MNKGFILLLGILIFSCSKKAEKEHSCIDYNIKIDYLSTPINDTARMNSEFLVVDFAGNYNQDTATLYINGEKYAEEIMKDDEVLGDGGHIKAIEYEKIKTIGIRINSGKLIYIEPEDRHYNIQVYYYDNTAFVRFFRLLPARM